MIDIYSSRPHLLNDFTVLTLVLLLVLFPQLFAALSVLLEFSGLTRGQSLNPYRLGIPSGDQRKYSLMYHGLFCQ